jgi:hypothetical protein
MDEHVKKANIQQDDGRTIHPRLVSFVGNTGAGKSSMIGALLGHLWDPAITNAELRDMVVPVPGDCESSLPTSSDMHLYQDPIEARTNPERPLLFADCEGFGAANRSVAATSRAKSAKEVEEAAQGGILQHSAAQGADWAKRAFFSAMSFMTRELSWGTSDTDRSKAVEQLFPRIVYNISDVVVYVLSASNLKTMGKVLEKLVEWSRKAETSSVNRTVLPSLVILINQCKKTKLWDSSETTDQILEENAYLLEGNETIRNRKDELSRLRLPHASIKDILGNSYAEVKFIRMPEVDDTQCFQSQCQELHAMIDSLTQASQSIKERNSMLLSSEQMQKFYQLTFDHFSNSTTAPFNYLEAFFEVNPSPAELWGNFFELLKATFDAARRQNPDSRESLVGMVAAAVAPIICSTVALDSRRRQFPGRLPNIFRRDVSEHLPGGQGVRNDSYEQAAQRALEEFVDSTIPCGHAIDSMHGELERACVNSKRAHNPRGDKDVPHQDSNGEQFGYGPFDSHLEDRFRGLWAHILASELEDLNDVGLPDLRDRHRQAIRNLHRQVPGTSLLRLPSCVWCMQNFPTERLPCDHWICPSCVVELGRKDDGDDRVFIVDLCDQHPDGMRLEPPFEFLNLPNTVGRRLLSLEEGGVRGIWQLKLLAELQDRMGEEIPIQDCFDLIGGTGSGGINALGLGVSGWHVSQAIEKFRNLVPKAFATKVTWSVWHFWREDIPYSVNDLICSVRSAFGQDARQPMTKFLVRLHCSSGSWR